MEAANKKVEAANQKLLDLQRAAPPTTVAGWIDVANAVVKPAADYSKKIIGNADDGTEGDN